MNSYKTENNKSYEKESDLYSIMSMPSKNQKMMQEDEYEAPR